MKTNYFTSIFLVLFLLVFHTSIGQVGVLNAANDFVSIPNGSATTVVIQDVLANDLYNGLPVTLSDVNFSQISTTSNYLSLNPTTGSVLFSNGPAPVGTYYLDYEYTSNTNPNIYGFAHVYVNIGCESLYAPIVTNVIPPGCNSAYGTVSLAGLPDAGEWYLFDNGNYVMTGTGTTATITNLTSGYAHQFFISNYQDCHSPSSAIVDFRYLLGTLQGTYADTNADGIVSVGDVITYHCSVTNQSSCVITNIHNSPTNQINLGGPIASLAPGATNNTTLTATHTILQTDINLGYVNKYTSLVGTAGSVSSSIYSTLSTRNNFNLTNGIRLLAFIDTNGNGIKDDSEALFTDGTFDYQINNDGVVHHIAANQICYLYENNPTNSYNLVFSINPNYAQYYGLTAPAYPNVTIPNGSGITTYSFPLTIVPYSDAAISLWANSNPRPGFTYVTTLRYRNAGNQIIPAGTVTFTKSPVVSMLSISEPGVTLTPTGFTYDFTTLTAGEYRDIAITFQVPTIPTVALGDLVTHTATITAPIGDVNTINNTMTSTQTIVGSYDPNEKEESHGSKILYAGFTADDYLTYTIRFENTGTANAEFIKVVDVLNDQLDETTVKMLSSSHNYSLDRVGSTLTWFFDDIQLPPSVANTNIGHGYVVFQVKPKPGFVLGDIIPNTADIFFDFNPAIVTNTCTTEFVNALATTGFAFDDFSYYPNPVKNNLLISNKTQIERIRVISLLGQEVLSKEVHDFKASVDLSLLTKGIYFVKVTAQGQEKVLKISKE